jgi:hypothetical protein
MEVVPWAEFGLSALPRGCQGPAAPSEVATFCYLSAQPELHAVRGAIVENMVLLAVICCT